MTDIASPALDFEAIYNFRDFGGYAARGGKVRKGLLFRSAHYADATSADLTRFAGLGIDAIVDLRRPSERVRFPSRRAPDCPARVVSYGDESADTEPPHLSFLGQEGVDIPFLRERMTRIYDELAFEPGHITVFSDAFSALADVDGAVVMHCHAGKDRTGLIVSLVHHVLGVGEADVTHDYLLTNTVSRIEERLPALGQTFRENHGLDAAPPLLRYVLGVEKVFLDAAYASIMAREGSVDGYLEKRLGVTPAMQDRIRARLIEPA